MIGIKNVSAEAMTVNVLNVNETIPVRATLFLEPELIKVLTRVYGCKSHTLDVSYQGEPVSAFRIKRPGTDRFCFAPFNFQPVFRDLASDITREIVATSKRINSRSTARVKLHHALPAEIVDELELKVASNTVETLLALNSSADVTYAALPKKQRWKLKTARANAAGAGVIVRQFNDETTLGRFYNIMLQAYRDKHQMIPQPYALLRDLLKLNNGKRCCNGYVAERRDNGEILGGIFLSKDEFQWSYAWAANLPNPDVEALGLGTLLVGQAICDAADAGALVFSFGVSPLSHITLRNFKRNWGAVEHPVYDYFYNEQPQVSDLHTDFRVIKKGLSITPLPIIRVASKLAVKWLV